MGSYSRKELWVVVGILALAVFFRFYHLSLTPPGLYPDEAINGVNALVANATHHWSVFYPENTGREGLFINLQAISVHFFGTHAWALRGVSALIGVLTVLGLYLVTRELFDWRVAALSSFLMAISFWAVNLSRIGFRAILLPLILVYGFYFLWRGLRSASKQCFFWAGVIFGLGFYTYTSYRITPLILIIVFVQYWFYAKKNYDHAHYEHVRNRLLEGFVILALVACVVALPLGLYFLHHPDQFFGEGWLSVFAQANPIHSLVASTVQTLGMFNFAGDMNQRQNIAGQPMLGWPIGLLFLFGFIKELVHWLRRKHGHLSPTHTLLFSWFFVMLLPGMLSIQAPHALRTIGALPVAMIFAGRGLWWIFTALGAWYEHRFPTADMSTHHHIRPGAVWALVFVLAALVIFEYNRYFNVWATDPATAAAFNQDYVDIANQINALPANTPKYVIVSAPGVISDLPSQAHGIPIPAETIVFLTDSATPESAAAHHITYLTPASALTTRFVSGARIFYVR